MVVTYCSTSKSKGSQMRQPPCQYSCKSCMVSLTVTAGVCFTEILSQIMYSCSQMEVSRFVILELAGSLLKIKSFKNSAVHQPTQLLRLLQTRGTKAFLQIFGRLEFYCTPCSRVQFLSRRLLLRSYTHSSLEEILGTPYLSLMTQRTSFPVCFRLNLKIGSPSQRYSSTPG